MLDATVLILSLILFSAVVISVLIARPAITATRGGKDARLCRYVLFTYLLRAAGRF